MTDNNIYKYIPNFITLLCLSSGFTSIMYSLNNEWKIAIYLILIATIFDFYEPLIDIFQNINQLYCQIL